MRRIFPCIRRSNLQLTWGGSLIPISIIGAHKFYATFVDVLSKQSHLPSPVSHRVHNRRHRILECSIFRHRLDRARSLPRRIIQRSRLPDRDVGHAASTSTEYTRGPGVCVCVWSAGAVYVASVVRGPSRQGWVGGLGYGSRVCSLRVVLHSIEVGGEVVG